MGSSYRVISSFWTGTSTKIEDSQYFSSEPIAKSFSLFRIEDFFRTGKLSKGIGSSFVTLISKTKGSCRFFKFRPISLIHGLYKIVAKILSTRLRSVLPDVISVNQSAFIARRQILDVISVSQC